MHLELEVNLLVHNVIEKEIEREKVQMKPPYISLSNPIFLNKNKELVLVVKVTIWYIAQWWRLGSCVWWKIILSMES